MIDNKYNLSNDIARQVDRLRQASPGGGRERDKAVTETSFRELLDRSLEKKLSFSKHADMRVRGRNIEIGESDLSKLSDACDKAGEKGIKDALIVMNDSVFIVNASSKTVVTVVDKNEMTGNIFTNIEGAVFL
jgi:flagellar operon protein